MAPCVRSLRVPSLITDWPLFFAQLDPQESLPPLQPQPPRPRPRRVSSPLSLTLPSLPHLCLWLIASACARYACPLS